MKKNANTTNNATENKSERIDYFKAILNKVEDIIANATKNEKGNATRYELADGVLLTIVDSDKERDLGSLNIYGLSVNVSIAMGKNGAFVSYPSYKAKDGSYKDLVTSYSKALNDTIKEVLAKHYEG